MRRRARRTKPAKKKGNRVARFFKAPFKAFGKLFGGGKKDGHIERMTREDAERFESVAVARVDDGRSDKAVPSGKDGTAREHLERGRSLLESGRVNEAIAELSRAASLDPKLAQAHSLLAVAYDRKGLHERARESYERSIGASTEDAAGAQQSRLLAVREWQLPRGRRALEARRETRARPTRAF